MITGGDEVDGEVITGGDEDIVPSLFFLGFCRIRFDVMCSSFYQDEQVSGRSSLFEGTVLSVGREGLMLALLNIRVARVNCF